MDLKRLVPFTLALGLLVIACGSGSTADAPPAMEKAPTGKELFALHCALCHGRDGKLGINGAKDLTVSALTKEEMTAIVTSGKGAMMPYKNVLTARQIEAVVEHVRTLHP